MKKRLQLCLSLACFWALGTNHVMGNDNSTHHKTSLFSKLESTSFLTNSHLMRVWRVALPVTKNTLNERFGGNTDDVRDFWKKAEKALNEHYAPVGFCFQVADHDQLIGCNSDPQFDANPPSIFGYNKSKSEMDKIISENSYDISLWIIDSKTSTLTGQADMFSAYVCDGKSKGFSDANVQHVCHELGHLLGSKHTHRTNETVHSYFLEPGLGTSMMSYGNPRTFFSLFSIDRFRHAAATRSSAYFPTTQRDRNTLVKLDNQAISYNTNYLYGLPTDSSTPSLDEKWCQPHYRIPQGACFAIHLSGTDPEGYPLKFAFQPVSQPFNVMQMPKQGLMTKPETEDGHIDYRPQYDVYDSSTMPFMLIDGSDPTTVAPGDYTFWMAAIRQPKHTPTYENFIRHPFYPAIDAYETKLTIVAGTPFQASITPVNSMNQYKAGEKIVVTWGVNDNFFDENSKVRLSLSTDFGNSFPHILAEGVRAKDGQCEVVLPQKTFDKVAYNGSKKRVRAGIIKVEVEDGLAYTLTCLSPTDAATHKKAEGGFTVSKGYVSFTNTPESYIVVKSRDELPPKADVQAKGYFGNNIPTTYQEQEKGQYVVRTWSGTDVSKTFYYRQIIRIDNSSSTTSIASHLLNNMEEKAPAYDIQGRKAGNDHRGITIVRGKKVMR